MKINDFRLLAIFVWIFLASNSYAAANCLEAMNKICGSSKNKIQCLQEKKSSLPIECRTQMKNSQKLASQIKPECVQTITKTCPMDYKKIKTDQKAYMDEYQKCLLKNMKTIKASCGNIEALINSAGAKNNATTRLVK